MATLFFLRGLCGYVWVNILNHPRGSIERIVNALQGLIVSVFKSGTVQIMNNTTETHGSTACQRPCVYIADLIILLNPTDSLAQ